VHAYETVVKGYALTETMDPALLGSFEQSRGVTKEAPVAVNGHWYLASEAQSLRRAIRTNATLVSATLSVPATGTADPHALREKRVFAVCARKRQGEHTSFIKKHATRGPKATYGARLRVDHVPKGNVNGVS
jgi:hypothetical protein